MVRQLADIRINQNQSSFVNFIYDQVVANDHFYARSIKSSVRHRFKKKLHSLLGIGAEFE